MTAREPVLRCRRAYRSFAGLYLGAAALAVAAWVVGWQARAEAPLAVTAALGLVPPLAAAAWSWLARVGEEYRVFDDSIEVETGILRRRIGNVQLFRVRDLGLAQSLLGRLLGVGDVTVTSTDQTSPQLVLRGIADPRAAYETVRDLVARSQAMRRTMIVEDEGPHH